jgi:RNA polymerase sigma-B factor
MNLTAEHATSAPDTATGRLLRAFHERGEESALTRLVDMYVPLVEALAERHGRTGNEHDELMQAGEIALFSAIQRFDLSRGSDFIAFAVPKIVGEIERHLRYREAAARLPRRLQEADARLPKAMEELTESLGRPPTVPDLAQRLGLKPEELATVAKVRRGEGALDEAVTGKGTEPDDSVPQTGVFAALEPRERRIIYFRYVCSMAPEEVAGAVDLPRRELGRRTATALAKLRRELERNAKQEASAAATGPHVAEAGPARDNTEAGPTREHTGRVVLQLPNTLHVELARAAERQHMSLNQFIAHTLAREVSRGHTGEQNRLVPRAVRMQKDGGGESPRWLPAAIVTNIVIVVVAGILALVLLFVAWQQGF